MKTNHMIANLHLVEGYIDDFQDLEDDLNKLYIQVIKLMKKMDTPRRFIPTKTALKEVIDALSDPDIEDENGIKCVRGDDGRWHELNSWLTTTVYCSTREVHVAFEKAVSSPEFRELMKKFDESEKGAANE